MSMTSLHIAMLLELETYKKHPLGFQLDDASQDPSYLNKLFDAFQKAKAGESDYKFEKIIVSFNGAKQEGEEKPKWKITYMDETIKP